MHWIAGCVRSSTAPRRSAGSPPARMRASVAAIALLVALPASAQPRARNPEVDAMLNAIRAESIEGRVRQPVSFGTRHTLSRPGWDRGGTGAGRRWIEAELDQCPRAAGGRLRVELDSFTQPP